MSHQTGIEPPLTMHDLTLVRQKIADLRCCVIIPTYNNDLTLAKVVQGALAYTIHIIVVNDGSTDGTDHILRAFPQITVIRNEKNHGKGLALRKGFAFAIEKGFRYAITIDSDGQHFVEDIPAFLGLIEHNPDAMIVGARDMNQKGIPGTSTFGHRFSIFWFKVETGLPIADVQTGYRLYPLKKIKEISHFYTRKYEF
ncbi:MAG: glycosyltransferase family 2 protein, partial [Bacteroidota bacterium]